jgi:hypothetical protein
MRKELGSLPKNYLGSWTLSARSFDSVKSYSIFSQWQTHRQACPAIHIRMGKMINAFIWYFSLHCVPFIHYTFEGQIGIKMRPKFGALITIWM